MDPKEAASKIAAEVRALSVRKAPNARAIRRRYSRVLEQADSEFILDVARELLESHGQRWLAC